MFDTSEFARDRRLSGCVDHPDSAIFQGSSDGSDSEPDIDVVMARCKIGVINNTVSGLQGDEVNLLLS